MMANRQRSPNFTTEETFFLLESLEKVIHVIENKKNDGRSVKEKEVAWLEVEKAFKEMKF